MEITIRIDPSWLLHAQPLGRILDHVRALEAPAPWSPPAAREPGQDDDQGDDLGVLLAGMNDPEPAAAPPPAAVATPPPALKAMPDPTIAAQISGSQAKPAKPAIIPPTPWCGPPRNGQALYKWACAGKCLPAVNAIGKAHGWHRLVTHWTAEEVAAAFAELTASTEQTVALNGRPH
jgi:hypothetical protein